MIEGGSDKEAELVLFVQCLELLQELPDRMALDDARTELLQIRDFYTRRKPKKTLPESTAEKVIAEVR